MGSMKDYFIKDKAEEGQRVDLHLPTGEKTDDYIVIRSIHSETFISAMNKAKQDFMLARIENEDAEIDNNKVLASLIKSWSFDEELTPESATEFLTNAPQVGEQINKLAADAKFHYGKKSKDS